MQIISKGAWVNVPCPKVHCGWYDADEKQEWFQNKACVHTQTRRHTYSLIRKCLFRKQTPHPRPPPTPPPTKKKKKKKKHKKKTTNETDSFEQRI